MRGILYVEGYTDIQILRAWAARLDHRAATLLATEIMWKPVVFQTREGAVGGGGVRAREHHEALQLVRNDFPGIELIDGDAHPNIQESAIATAGLRRLRWRRYEIESYLVHPDALGRFVETMVGQENAASHVEDMFAHWRDEFPPAIMRDPLGNHEFLNSTKARKRLIPPLLEAAGIHNVAYTRYHEIAQMMRPEEIHPEVTEKLDTICQVFEVQP